MTKNIIIAVLAVALLGLGFFSFSNSQLFGATGTAHYQKESFLQGLFFGTTRQANLASDGSADLASLAFDSGTAITEHGCTTFTLNPGSLSSSTNPLLFTTSTDIAMSGAAMGDSCSGSLTSATSSVASIKCDVTGTATATLRIFNWNSAALDLATGTARVCYTAH